MKKNLWLILICSSLVFSACNTTTPENYFDIAVLNTNMLVGFAGEGQSRQLEYSSVKADAKGLPVTMKRQEELDQKIKFLEECFQKVKALQPTGETKEMLQTAIDLYEYVLPVYKTEYRLLAKMYDDGASKHALNSQTTLIYNKYFSGFALLQNKLLAIGKTYAVKHSIDVNWHNGA